MIWSSCRKDFDFAPSTGNLEFSKDTLFLDTIFTNFSSSTYSLKVYNKSNNDISIPTLRLGLGESSSYRLNIDGIPGKVFEDVELLANDSLYIFIETTFNTNEQPVPENQFLYTDAIEFDTGSNEQKVELITLIQDATLIFPNRDANKVIETLTLNINGEPVETEFQGRELLPEELTFTNKKPYIIYGFATVPTGENSGIIVSNNASIQVNGEFSEDQDALDNEVIFESDRLESSFSDTPGQWDTIWLLDGSINNTFNYTTIKNATIGILCDGNPDDVNDKLTITNSKIYNSSNFGILGRNTSIAAENLVINNTGQSAFAGTSGGKYNFTHSTLTNYWTNSIRQLPTILLRTFPLDTDEDNTTEDLVEANFNNCIIYGNNNSEIEIENIEDDVALFNFKFTNCLIRFNNINNSTDTNYDITDIDHYENNIFNEDPNFKDTSINDLIIGEESAAINKGLAIYATQVSTDILNVDRTMSPDLGAYQHIIFPEEEEEE